MDYIASLVVGILTLIMSVMCFFEAGKAWPEQSYWKGLPYGRYITREEYGKDRIVIRDTYGNEVIVFERKQKEVT